MKKLLMLVVLVGLPSLALVGCGGSGNVVNEGGEAEPYLNQQQMSDYEEQMRSGAAGSSAPGN